MGRDGNLYLCPTTSYRPMTITQLSDTSTIPYHLPQLLPSHPTHHDETSYHLNTIPSVSHLSHVHTNTIVYHPKPSIRSLLRDIPTRLQVCSQQTSPSQTQHINTSIHQSSANMADPPPIGIGEPAGPQPPTDVQTPAVSTRDPALQTSPGVLHAKPEQPHDEQPSP